MKRLLLLIVTAFAFQFSFAQWATSGSNIYNSNSGNVGIGTTSPGNILEVARGSAYTEIVGSSNNPSIRIRNTQSSNFYEKAEVQFIIGNNLYPTAAITDLYTGWTSPGASSGNVGSDLAFSTRASTDVVNTLTERMRITGSGNVGIGTTSPSAVLDVANGNAHMQFASGGSSGIGEIFRMWGPNGMVFSTNSYVPASGNLITDLGVNYSIDGSNGTQLYARIGTKKAPIIRLNAENGSISLYGESGSGSDFRTPTHNLGLIVQSSGNVAIGTTDAQGYKLAVNGDAIFTKVKVKTYATWPDYVFHRSYKLRPLKDLESYIRQNNHLPDVPSASEVEKNGLDLGDNQATLLKKIEELTMYMIDVNKEVQKLKQENASLKKKVANIKRKK